MKSPSIAIFLILANVSLIASAASTLPTAVAAHLKREGPVINRELFQTEEPRKQLAVYYCVDENLPGGKNEGASNPANVHCNVALFNRRGTSWAFANKRSLGQGKVVAFKHGIITAQSLTYKPDDPLCCPSVTRNISFTTRDGTLALTKSAR
jgi:hypothetical protein